MTSVGSESILNICHMTDLGSIWVKIGSNLITKGSKCILLSCNMTTVESMKIMESVFYELAVI